jgi:hypothetical protein
MGGNAACMVEMRNVYHSLVRKSQEDGRIILKWVLHVELWTGLHWLRVGSNGRLL